MRVENMIALLTTTFAATSIATCRTKGSAHMSMIAFAASAAAFNSNHPHLSAVFTAAGAASAFSARATHELNTERELRESKVKSHRAICMGR